MQIILRLNYLTSQYIWHYFLLSTYQSAYTFSTSSFFLFLHVSTHLSVLCLLTDLSILFPDMSFSLLYIISPLALFCVLYSPFSIYLSLLSLTPQRNIYRVCWIETKTTFLDGYIYCGTSTARIQYTVECPIPSIRNTKIIHLVYKHPVRVIWTYKRTKNICSLMKYLWRGKNIPQVEYDI